MAKLSPPKVAMRGREDGKWHLANPRRGARSFEVTVCKRIYWDGGDHEEKSVKKIDPDDLCKRCLGPCEAV